MFCYILECLFIPIQWSILCTGHVQSGFQEKLQKDFKILMSTVTCIKPALHSTACGILWPWSSIHELIHGSTRSLCRTMDNKAPALFMPEPALLKKKSKTGFCIFLPTQVVVWTTTATCRVLIPHFKRKPFRHLKLENCDLLPFSLPLLLQALQTWAILYSWEVLPFFSIFFCVLDMIRWVAQIVSNSKNTYSHQWSKG